MTLASHRSQSAEREKPSSRRKESWTPEEVAGYFSGWTDAASHLAERTANTYLNSGQPLTPFPPEKPPRLQESSTSQELPITRLQSKRKLFSETDPSFLDHPTCSKMGVRRCTVCHLFIEGSLSPELAHVGPFGPSCVATHHPNPCDYVSKDGGVCTHYVAVKEGHLTVAQLQARDKVRQDELDRMSSEMVTLRQQQVDMNRITSEMFEMKQLMISLRPSASAGSTLAPPASSSASSPQDFTSGSHSAQVTSPLVPDLSLLGAAGGGTAHQNSIHEYVSRHIQNNTVPPPTTQHRGAYTGPTMPDLRRDDTLNIVTQQVLAVLEQRIPQIREHFASPDPNLPPSTANGIGAPISSNVSLSTATRVTSSLNSRPVTCSAPLLQPMNQDQHPAYLALLGGHHGQPGIAVQPQYEDQPQSDDFLDAAQIMNLCTVSNRRQLRPHEFVRLGRFSYANKITDKNITVPLFVMGYLQYVVAILKGVAPRQSETEVIDRLNNLLTIMEITANNSTLEDFKSPGWSIGLEYAGRIFHDIEYGRLNWEDLSQGLQAHTFLYAKDTVEMQQGKGGRGSDQPRGGRGAGRGAGGRGPSGRGGRVSDRSDSNQGVTKVCQSYNGFWTGSGCAYEYNNNRKCGYEHYCSACFEKSGSKETHKSYYCKSDGSSSSTSKVSGSEASKPTVTSG